VDAVEKRKDRGDETGSRGRLKGVGHFCLVFRNKHTLRRAIQVSQICKLNLNRLHYRSELIFCVPVKNPAFFLSTRVIIYSTFVGFFFVFVLGPGPRGKGML
jgi:hypothetical protein